MQSCWEMKCPKVLWYTHEQTLYYLDKDKKLWQHPTKAPLTSHSQPENKIMSTENFNLLWKTTNKALYDTLPSKTSAGALEHAT